MNHNFKYTFSKTLHKDYPFGMQMPGRNFSSDEYRYGFNGMEKDDEVKGSGNSYTTEFRLLDPRIARWLSIDPVVHHNFSPYSAFDNNPIFIKDPSGADGEEPGETYEVNKGDNLSTIAEANNTTVDEIKSANSDIDWGTRGDNQDLIFAGETLNLPGATNSTSSTEGSNSNNDKGWHPPMLPNENSQPTSEEGSLLGPENLIGPSLILAGQPLIPKNSALAKAIFPRSAKVLGARANTSLASLAARRFGQGAGLKLFGRVAGRAVPVVGWVWTAYDIIKLNEDYVIANQYGGDRAAYEREMSNRIQAESGTRYLCFIAGTEVYTVRGLIPIETLTVQDSVYSYNVNKDEIEVQAVINVMNREVHGIYEIQIDNELIYVTEEHPFYVVGKRDWVKVKDLNVGDNLLNSNGEKVKIQSIIRQKDADRVYNITIDGNHNYFVGKSKVLVHNK